jgi:hypothetical protein
MKNSCGDDAVEAGPSVAFVEPIDVMEYRVGPPFNAAMITADRRMAADLGVFEVIGLLLGAYEPPAGLPIRVSGLPACRRPG